MIDNKTPFLTLPLPHEANELQEDLPRLRQSLTLLDAHAKAETEARSEGDTAITNALHAETENRTSQITALQDAWNAAGLAETAARQAGDEAGAAAAAQALQAHDENAGAHNALIRRITVGDISPVIGICQLETGNSTGLWYNCDADGQPITPNTRYFDYHPIYSGMRRVLVDGQVMVENKPFWIKTMRPDSGPFAGKLCKIISPGPADGFRPYPAFLSQTGAVLDNIYIGAYAGTDEGGGKAGSRPGKIPLGNLDFPTMQARCTSRNVGGVAGFRMWDFYHYSAICLLFVVEHTTTESQLIMGRGYVDSTATTCTDYHAQPQWRGYVGLYGNVWQMVDGLRLTPSRGIEMFKVDGSRTWAATGKSASTYDGVNPTFVVTNHTGESNGFSLDDFFLPATHSTSYLAGTFPDYFYGGFGSAGNVMLVGGAYSSGNGAGLFCNHFTNFASQFSTSVGCRLAKS